MLLNDELVSAHQIVDVRHIKGKNSSVDGISRQWAPGCEQILTDGGAWSVNPDWEERMGLVHNIFTVTPTDGTDLTDILETRFATEPLFLQVVLEICDKDTHWHSEIVNKHDIMHPNTRSMMESCGMLEENGQYRQEPKRNVYHKKKH
jgi:hypothetical protein